MRSICLFLSVLALATAAIHPTGPVYRSAASVVYSTPVGKSLPQGEQQPMPAQPLAEERLAADNAAPVSSVQANVVPVSAVAPVSSPAQSQNFKVVYFPNPSLQQPYQYPQQGTDFWTHYHVDDVLVGAGSLFLIGLGGYISFPLFASAKARAMRQLSEIKSEDASRMAKGILEAIEKVYEMNKGPEQLN